MADISKITLPNNTTYNIKDATARSDLSGKQDTITASGILQGDGSGTITGLSSATASTISIDTTPTEDSNNLVTSGGVYAAIGSSGGGTVSSVGVSNATNGGLTVSGSPITGSGTITVGHTNVLTSAQTTQAVYPIKIDKNGHISAYGSAATIPSAADASPLMDGTAAVGTSTDYAREDHVHPTDTSRQAKITASGILKGDGNGGVTAATAGTDYIASSPITNGTGTSSAILINSTNPNTASGDGAVALGSDSVASGLASFATGAKVSGQSAGPQASGAASIAFGGSTVASGNYSLAIGNKSQATKAYAFAGGLQALADGSASFAYGQSSTAAGSLSVAIGDNVTATASRSAAFGSYNEAAGRSQFVVGQYNLVDTDDGTNYIDYGTGTKKYVFMVGNGTATDARSNAMTVDWNGNEVIGGDFTVHNKVKLQYNSTTQALDFIFI